MSQNMPNTRNTKIAADGTITIPKEMLSDAQLYGEVELIKCEEGILIKPKAQKSWGDFFETKLKMNKPIYIDLSEVNEDEFMY
jgi:bifunctional DNA-binding transcriptional regulator/antitoxin component of YhaV-PrlF toxin-antitoxin module